MFLIIQPAGPRGSEETKLFPFQTKFPCWECDQKDQQDQKIEAIFILIYEVWQFILKQCEDSHVCPLNPRVNCRFVLMLSFRHFYMLNYFGCSSPTGGTQGFFRPTAEPRLFFFFFFGWRTWHFPPIGLLEWRRRNVQGQTSLWPEKPACSGVLPLTFSISLLPFFPPLLLHNICQSAFLGI